MGQKALLPLFPLDLVLLPGEILPLRIFEARYRTMISAAHRQKSEFGIVWQSEGHLEHLGCAAKVREVTRRFEDGQFNIDAIGTRRFRVHSFDESEDVLQGAVEFFGDASSERPSRRTVQSLTKLGRRVMGMLGKGAVQWNLDHPWLSFQVAADLGLAPEAKQALLRTRTEAERVERLMRHLRGIVAGRERRKERQRLVRSNGRLRH